MCVLSASGRNWRGYTIKYRQWQALSQRQFANCYLCKIMALCKSLASAGKQVKTSANATGLADRHVMTDLEGL